jgi:hypothetical protein
MKLQGQKWRRRDGFLGGGRRKREKKKEKKKEKKIIVERERMNDPLESMDLRLAAKNARPSETT